VRGDSSPRRPFDGFSFVPAAGWSDQTLVSFVAAPGQKSGNVAITRAPLDEGTTLWMYGERQLIDLSKRLNAFELQESSVRRVDGRDAMYVRFKWVSHYGEIEQSITSLCAGNEVLAITTTALMKDAPALRPVFDAAVASFRVDRA
jgi:hypothetical protein